MVVVVVVEMEVVVVVENSLAFGPLCYSFFRR